MGHRTLIAYRRTDGTFTLRYAHWGTGLGRAITATTPLGALVERPGVRSVADQLDTHRPERRVSHIRPRIDPRPLTSGADAKAITDAVDPTIESLVVVTPTYETTTYLVCSLDPSGGDSDLVLARPADSSESLRRWFVEFKSRVSAAVAEGTLTRGEARERLRRSLATRATLYSTDDASFLRDP